MRWWDFSFSTPTSSFLVSILLDLGGQNESLAFANSIFTIQELKAAMAASDYTYLPIFYLPQNLDRLH